MAVSVRAVLLEGPKPKGPYTYASTPRALYNNVRMRRDPPCEDANAEKHSNLMHDKRVVRGNTFAAHPMAHGDGGAGGPAAGTAAARRLRARARRAAMRLRPGTPPPAPGRRHHPVQTELYLEELFDKGQEMTVGVQTDLFVDRPPTPLYVPAKTGADAHTQIYPGDLFDFDLEVSPVLEALVGGTATQALGEVAREEELAALRQHQRRFRELRDAERAERRRLAEQDHRLHVEKERRVAMARAAAVAADEARARAAAAVLVQGYVAELLPAALAGLREQGYLVERTKRGVEDEFMPWLVTEVSRELECIITSRDVISELVREVVEARAELYASAGERDAARESAPDSVTLPSQLQEEEERAEQLPAGAERLLTAADLLVLCQDRDDDDEQVLSVRLERDGRLGAAAAQARVAPHGLAASLQLEPADVTGRLRLRLPRALAASAELRLWPAPALLLAAQVPFLLPRHIRGWSSYVCDVCGACFSEPNPLKAHLFLRCGTPAPATFWRELLARLAPPPAPRPAPAASGHRCVYCGRVYSRRYGLRIHTRTHTGLKPLRCPHCARAFADPSNLNKHVRLHKARAARQAAEL